MQNRVANGDSGKWQRYKEWLVAQTSDSLYPADANALQQQYETGRFPALQSENGFHCEARTWMTNPVASGYLAGNRFGSREEGLRFIENLYRLGAKTVYAVNIDHDMFNFDNGGPGTDTLIVTLPDDLQQRRALLDVAEAEASLYDGPATLEDDGRAETMFWWD